MGNFLSKKRTLNQSGMTLIEVVVTSGIIMILFIAIYEVFIVSIDVVTTAKARAGALAIAVERMEQIRSQSYSALGTVNGIPAGSVPQSEQVLLNQTTYIRRTVIVYVDDPSDGSGASDTNGITTDYKQAKVEVVWSIRGVNRTFSLISNIIPPGIESVVGGGTLKVQVFDAFAAPISGASVRVVNTSGTSTVDVTTFTNALGFVLFPGTPSGSGYQITVTKSGYSSAQTYSVSAGNPNPSPGHLSIATSQTTSSSFAIDRLSTLTVSTLKPIEEATWSDTFTDASGLGSSASTTVSGGSITLTDDAGVFDTSGSAASTPQAPTYLYAWKEASFTANSTVGNSYRVRVYWDNNGTLTQVPDSVIPGNSGGFASSPISLLNVSTTTYPSLALNVSLTSDGAESPSLLDWALTYDRGPVPIPNIPLEMRGSKTIGTNSSGQSVYKFSQTLDTGASGALSTTTLEWDTYTINIDSSTGYDISEACVPIPLSIAPNTNTSLNLFLKVHTTNSLLVSVRDDSTDVQIGNVSVRLTNTGVDSTQNTSSCGQTFFSALSSASTYTLLLTKAGYQTQTINNVTVTGQTSVNASLTPQ